MSRGLARLVGHWPHPEPSYHLVQFSKRTLERILVHVGFDVVELADERIPLGYSFRDASRSLRRLLYAAAFAPLALVGPLLRAGDSMVVIARKRSEGRPPSSAPRM
jgi:hypothetical protein